MSTPLHLALANGNEKVAEFLIDHGTNVNAQDNKKSTPLHLASLNGNLDLVKILLERNAEVNARDNRRRTPLHWIIRCCATYVRVCHVRLLGAGKLRSL